MAETIESFVQKLQAEGVQAGQDQAKKLLDEASAQAESIVADAKARGEKIVADANTQAEAALAQGADELKLAARDALLRLRETVQSTLEALLKQSAGDALKDNEFFVRLLHDVAVQYAQKDSLRESPVEINVDEKMLKAATHWAVKEMTGKAGPHPPIDLKGALKTAGFEYTPVDGTIEVTPESIASVLSEMIGPRLAEVIQAAQAAEEA